MTKSKKEIKKWLLKNCVDDNGDLDLSYLDFSDFDGNVILDHMIVKGNLSQSYQTVKHCLVQAYQKVGTDLYQFKQNVKLDMYDDEHEVEGDFITQTLKDDEEYKIINNETYIVKKTEELSKEEIEEKIDYNSKNV